MASNVTSDKEASRSDSGSDEDTGYHNANLLFEYRWPPHDAYADTFMLQEQVVEYLEIRGFSRKYPGEWVFSVGTRRESDYVFGILHKIFTTIPNANMQSVASWILHWI